MEVSFNDVSQVQKQLNYLQNLFFQFFNQKFFQKALRLHTSCHVFYRWLPQNKSRR
jgi:hypothetical protein